MGEPSTIELVAALSDGATRTEAARVLAERLGADELILFVPDPELGTLLPAPGFAQTLRGGAAWRSFLAGASPGRHHEARVDLPAGSMRTARAIAHGDLVAVLLGGEPREAEVAAVERVMPLLVAMLKAELAVSLAGADAADARESANRANALSYALEAARAEHARLNLELREEHRRKDEFLAMLAHELRNPLSPLLSSLEIVRHPGVSAEQRDRQIDVMRRQVSHLSRLIEDLLDVSRVGRGRIELKRQRVALRDVLEQAIEECQPLLRARRHQLRVHVPEAVTVDVDPARMRQVFANLLNNAAKYTDPGGELALVAEREGAAARVCVQDNGIGIGSDMLPHVFDLFAQGHVSIERAQGGLGIGLTLVRMLVELHGGTVTVASPGPGRGSTFTVRLPLAEAGASANDSPEQPAKVVDARPLRVLVVDDNHDVADSMALMLGMMGHHAVAAYDGIKALQLTADLEPDLVFLDLGLPDMDGFEIARRIRCLGHRTPRLVALTGYGATEDKRRTREVGFDEHVVKPVSPEMVGEIAERTPARPGA